MEAKPKRGAMDGLCALGCRAAGDAADPVVVCQGHPWRKLGAEAFVASPKNPGACGRARGEPRCERDQRLSVERVLALPGDGKPVHPTDRRCDVFDGAKEESP